MFSVLLCFLYLFNSFYGVLLLFRIGVLFMIDVFSCFILRNSMAFFIRYDRETEGFLVRLFACSHLKGRWVEKSSCMHI